MVTVYIKRVLAHDIPNTGLHVSDYVTAEAKMGLRLIAGVGDNVKEAVEDFICQAHSAGYVPESEGYQVQE